jgi:hypothetical protein
MKNITTFKAVCSAGIIIPDAKSVTALSLIFDKIYLPSNIEFVKEFSRNYILISNNSTDNSKFPIIIYDGHGNITDPFLDLNDNQKKTAIDYLIWARQFSMSYGLLYGEVFETNIFPNNSPFDVKMVKKGKVGKKNTYNVKLNPMKLTEGFDTDLFSDLVSNGYVPLVNNINIFNNSNQKITKTNAKTLAALLAMKSVELVLPDMKSVEPELILEARHRLINHLPPFWSSMFKLSIELKKCLDNCKDNKELIIEGGELVDTIVRPALIDLNKKIELERKNWFYKILEPIGKTVRLLIGHPGLTIQELMTSSLLLSTEVASNTLNNMRVIDKLQSDSGLTYLMEINKFISNNT